MTNIPEEDQVRNSPRPRTLIELLDNATGSWAKTLRLLAVLWALFFLPVALVLGLIAIIVQAASKANLDWTTPIAITVFGTILTAGSVALARKLRPVIRREDAAESKLEVASEFFVASMLRLEKAGTEAAAPGWANDRTSFL